MDNSNQRRFIRRRVTAAAAVTAAAIPAAAAAQGEKPVKRVHYRNGGGYHAEGDIKGAHQGRSQSDRADTRRRAGDGEKARLPARLTACG
jgi:cobalamin biosynthesis protein CbiD